MGQRLPRRQSTLPSSTLLLPLLLAPAFAQGEAVGGWEAEATTILTEAAGADVGQLYTLGGRLADLAPDNNLEAFRDFLMRGPGKGSDARQRLVAALALRDLQNGTTFGKDLLDLAKPVAQGGGSQGGGSEGSNSEGSNDDLRAAALAVLGDERLFNTRLLPEVGKLVEQSASDERLAPGVRIEAALALWRVGSNEQRRISKQSLEQFLRSSDRDLQQRGALALAELNIEGGPAWDLLREIQDQPTPAGRAAKMYLRREEDRRQFEQMLARMSERSGAAAGDAPNDDYAVLSELRRRIRGLHVQGSTVTDAELIEYAAKGMLSGLDPHSTFFTSDEYKKFFFDLDREYGGIGAFVNFDQDNDFSIVRPIYSGPAYLAGLRSGDKILEVDSWETAGHTTDEIIARLKGKPDTAVTLKWFRPGFQEAQVTTIQRRQIKVPAVNWAMVPGEIGYIELINFSQNISAELQKALADLVAQGAKGIVLDVRNNTGGFLTQARDVVEQFVAGEKLVVFTQGPSEPKREYKTSKRSRTVCELPMCVLTNNLSASASEITAGALQDLGRATVIGERSFGKGSVQNLFSLASDPGEPFSDANDDNAWQEGEDYQDLNKNGKFDAGAHMKLTVAKYYLPSGRCPHREFDKEGRIVDPNWGVTPDKVVDLLENKPEDAWKNAAVFALLKKGVFRDYVKKHIGAHEQLFRELAEGDGGDPTRYPEFDAFYTGLDTKLGKDDVRRWLRYEVRDQISDLRGAVYPGVRAIGDPQEDAQLQEAVRTILQKLGQDVRQVVAYQNVLKIRFDDGASEQLRK
jgi:C-terminal peptidase prc